MVIKSNSIKVLKNVSYSFALMLSFLISSTVFAEDCKTGSPKVYFISPQDGVSLTSPIKVIFGIENFNISPAGIDKCNAGHHHLIIDTDILPSLSKPIPSDKKHLHFGKGQTRTFIDLKSGTHTLQLIFGDYMHVPHHKPLVSKKITITVE